MRYVIFDAASKEIRSAMTGPEPPEPGPGLRTGDAGDVTFEGALKNYVFVPDDPTASGTLTGRVERKPEDEWDLKAEKEEKDRHTAMMRFHQLDIADVRKLEILLMIPSRFARLLEPTVALSFTLEGVSLDVTLSHLKPIALDVGFEFGGYTVPFQRTSIRFDLSGHEPFIATALDV